MKDEDLKNIVFEMLKKYDGMKLNIMVAGGSIQNLLNNDQISKLETSLWSVFFSDERITENLTETNYFISKPFLSKLHPDATIYKINAMENSCIDDYNELLIHNKMDICLLGVGDDGHIASISPEINSKFNEKTYFTSNLFNVSPRRRLTITTKFLNEMVKNSIIFLIPTKLGKIKKIEGPSAFLRNRIVIPMEIYKSDQK